MKFDRTDGSNPIDGKYWNITKLQTKAIVSNKTNVCIKNPMLDFSKSFDEKTTNCNELRRTPIGTNTTEQ